MFKCTGNKEIISTNWNTSQKKNNECDYLSGYIKNNLFECYVEIDNHDIDNIKINQSSNALKYEVYIHNGDLTTGTNGNFSTATKDKPLTIVENYYLTSTTDYVTFDIFIWLDNSLITNNMIGKTFKATISADSTAITGEF